MTDIDLDSYGDPNDIGPDDPAPREPQGEPTVTTDRFRVWQFDADRSATVQDTYVVDRDPDPLAFRMWVFVGHGDSLRFALRASHRYGTHEVVPGDATTCCEVLFEGGSLAATHCPQEVERFVEDLTDAGVVMPRADDTGHGGPINY